MEGIEIDLDINAKSFPGAYEYTQKSTHVYANYQRGEWRITKIEREECTKNKVKIKHTEASKNALISRFTRW